MIELTEELVYEAMRLAKRDQDKIIKKAKEIENGNCNRYSIGDSNIRSN